MLGERLALAQRHLLCHQSGSYEVEAVKCVAVSLHTSHFMPFLQCKEVKETQNTRTHTHSISDKMLCVCLCVSVRGRVCAFVSLCLRAYVLVWESVSLNTMGLLRSFPVCVRAVRVSCCVHTINQCDFLLCLPCVTPYRTARQPALMVCAVFTPPPNLERNTPAFGMLFHENIIIRLLIESLRCGRKSVSSAFTSPHQVGSCPLRLAVTNWRWDLLCHHGKWMRKAEAGEQWAFIQAEKPAIVTP